MSLPARRRGDSFEVCGCRSEGENLAVKLAGEGWFEGGFRAFRPDLEIAVLAEGRSVAFPASKSIEAKEEPVANLPLKLSGE